MAKKNLEGGNLSGFLRDSINSAMKEGVAYSITDEATPSTVKGYISTGSTLLDVAISNKRDGGIPMGRLTEISGVESIGKSLIGAHILANTQKMGGIGVLIDTENAASIEILGKCGVNLDDLVYVQVGTIEEVFRVMESVITDLASGKGKDKDITIIWDSVAATSAKAEIDGDYGDHNIGIQARLISQGLRKIIPFIGKYGVTLVFINQLRMKIQAMPFSDPHVTPGGKAIPYFASVRIRLFKEAEIKNPTTKAVTGVRVKAEELRNKLYDLLILKMDSDNQAEEFEQGGEDPNET